MRNTSADLLEFEALKQLLARYVSSPLGRAELDKVAPGTDRKRIEEQLADTGESLEYARAVSRPHPAVRGEPVRVRFDSLPDTGDAVQKLRIEGAVLDALEIRQLTDLLDRADETRRLLLSVEERFPRLAAQARRMGDFRPLVREMSGKTLPDGTVADDASPFLARVRRDIEKQRKLIQESLERFLRLHREEGLLQEEFVAIRNERFVVPVIAGRQRRIEGVVHGSSGSGHTLFVEPLETIGLNNELVRLSEEELREVHRILRELTGRFREHLEAVHATVAILGELELLFAQGRFGTDFGCVIPRFSPPRERRLKLREARHPLLEDVLRRQGRPVVPLSVELDSACRTLLISGPNTGGKTVALKTAGLLALMAQAGLPVPCGEAEFPLFDQILADIGDKQSIQESLSTFSAHVCRVRDMLEAAGPDSLVLLDELGRATDPEEGGALGVAVMERFRACGAFTLSSTHLLALKVYGAGTDGVLNGSMGFDEQTLEPTYMLRLGAPGKSAGLEIARRLGMPAGLIEQARLRLGRRAQDLTNYLAQLQDRLDDVTRLKQELEEQSGALAAKRESLEREAARRESARVKEFELRSEEILAKFQERAAQVLDKIQAEAGSRKAVESALRRVAGLKRELQEQMQAAELSPDRPHGPPSEAAVREGSTVRLRGLSHPARVRRLLAGDLVEVEAGLMKMQVPAGDVIEVIPEPRPSARFPERVTFSPAPKAPGSLQEINVIGQHAEEACALVEKFLDDAVLADVGRVRIVHGHGMGVLRRAVSGLLAKNPNVDRFYPAAQHEGGAGATIVELKQDA